MSGQRVHRQLCGLSPPPPRTPARADPQVPHDGRLGPALWGKIGALYVYDEAGDALYGYNDLEISVQQIAPDRARLEIYAIGDGYQRGSPMPFPFRIRINSSGEMAADIVWTPPAIPDGCADPIAFAQDFALSGAGWRGLESIEIEGALDPLMTR